MAQLLGQEEFGRWQGVAKAEPWREADGSGSDTFESSFVKLVPSGTFWTACFNLIDPSIDVDIVLPVNWVDDVLEEVDLELDVLRFADGTVRVRDQDEFDRVRETLAMPNNIARQCEEACDVMRDRVESWAEPFGEVGHTWLGQFLREVRARGSSPGRTG